MNLPESVFYVQRIPGPNERKRYYSISTKRFYGSRAYAQQFIDAHPNDEFVIYESKTEWNKVDGV